MAELGFYIDSAGRVISTEKAPLPPRIAKEYELLDNPEARKRMGQEMATFVRTVHDSKPDVLVFLDKSARPASWFFRYVWQELYPSEKRPRIKYANIGREKEMSDSDELNHMLGGSAVDKFAANEKLIQPLKEAFLVRRYNQEQDKVVKTDQTYLDNKNVWIIDEASNTGTTLRIAETLFQAAFKNHTQSIIAKSIFSKDDYSWLRDSYMIGVQDRKPADMLTTPIRPIPDEVHLLRSELRLLAKEIASS